MRAFALAHFFHSKQSMSIAKGDAVPALRGHGKLAATSEIHIFLAPVLEDPDSEAGRAVVRKYKDAVSLWNAQELPRLKQRDGGVLEHGDRAVEHGPMKAPVLTLVFRDGAGEKPLTVCQSARYVYCNDVRRVQELCHEDAAFFAAQGLEVIREKIEATAHGIDGVPQTSAEAVRYPHLYFEFHIKVQRHDASGEPLPVTAQEEAELRAVANTLSRDLNVPIPLSYNREKNENNRDNGGCQRFLNVRFYGLGMQEIKPKLERIYEAIKRDQRYSVLKTISEYVWYDTNKAMDKGWIDYAPDELAALQQRLAAQ